MAEEEEHSAMTTPDDSARPQTARKDSRKVPGSFGFDDVDDLSPDKETFEDALFSNAQAYQQNARVPSFDPSTLPSLPPPTDSSLFYNQSASGQGSDAHLDTLDEKELHRHLDDVESSFLAAPETIGVQDNKGADDTYLFDGAQLPPHSRQSPRQDSKTPSKNAASSDVHDGDTPSSPPTPPNAYKTPAVASGDSTEVGNTTSSLETMSSSPTAAAAARTVSRAISMASARDRDEGGGDMSDTSLQGHSDNEGDLEATPRKPKDKSFLDPTDEPHSLRHRLSTNSLNNFTSDAGSTPGAALLLRKHSGKRPKFLRSRHASQHSSISSIPDSQDGSDVTLGADYALQSGGAVPAAGFSRSTSMALSRSISLGSMASGIEDYSGSADSSGRALDASLATLTEEEQNRERKGPEETSPPETPRATSTNRSLAAPTDTIIARHVRNVQVPESLAQEYRSKSGVSSPNKRSGFAVSTLGRNGKNLTLKEQSSTIERLSKENFDLKLKVMFLSDRLDKLSEEGVKEMISENVELKTGLATMQRDNKALRRKVKELEKRLQDDEERPSTAVSGTSAGDHPSPQWFDQEGAQEREEELVYLRERVEEYVTEIERLRTEGLTRENEKRNLAEVVRNMSERRGQNIESREEMDVWKDLLEQETARREQADEDNKKLREEIFRLKSETTSGSGVPGLQHTTNIYNITKKRQISPSRPRSELSDRMDDRNGSLSAASTLVEELRKDCDQLRHENAELRREVGAQTAMLTSRNKEKERLYQDIEDLKLAHRRGGSVAGESIFERSASRTHERSLSRASVGTRRTNLTDSEREDLENKNFELRDRINSLKIQNQDLQRELESCMEDFETAVEQKKQAEDLANELQEALEVAENDLLTIQSERDEALQGQDEAEQLFESLRKEAQEELDSYAAETDAAQAEIERLQNDLADSTENFSALQNEMREMSESVVRLEDSHENKSRRIDDLERDLEDANRELEQMEKNLQESNNKINHLTVQRESSQSEIAFLREEQDGDKIKIGDLETHIRKLEQTLREERDRVKDLEQRIKNERHQREVIAGKKQSEVEKQFEQFNRENSSLRDDCQRLKTKLNAAAGDAASNAQKVLELETGLRQALGDLHGTKSSLVGSVHKLNKQLDDTVRDVETLKRVLGEKDRTIHAKDDQLESQAIELRRLADIAEKERQAHRNTTHQFETFQKTTHHTSRTLTQQETRVSELESSRTHDRKKIASLENQLRDAMNERGNLLLTIWQRLSALCGAEWYNNNNLVNGRALPSLEVISNQLPGFAKNLLAAVKTIEWMMGDFKTRIQNVEKTLWKEYQTLESNLEVRTKRLDRLETMARSALPGLSGDARAEIHKLRETNKSLKTELSHLRAAHDVRSNVYKNPSPSPSVPTGPRGERRTSTMTRANSSSAVEQLEGKSYLSPTKGLTDSDTKWQLRLQELEYKLKAEREARYQDRGGAQSRLKEQQAQIKDLEGQLQRLMSKEKLKGGGSV